MTYSWTVLILSRERNFIHIWTLLKPDKLQGMAMAKSLATFRPFWVISWSHRQRRERNKWLNTWRVWLEIQTLVDEIKWKEQPSSQKKSAWKKIGRGQRSRSSFLLEMRVWGPEDATRGLFRLPWLLIVSMGFHFTIKSQTKIADINRDSPYRGAVAEWCKAQLWEIKW